MTHNSRMTTGVTDSQSLVDLVLNIATEDSMSVENVIKSAHKDWLEDSATSLSKDHLVMKTFTAKLNKLIHISDPPCFSNREHHDYEVSDFVGVADRTEIVLSFFATYLRCYLDIDRTQFLRDVIKCIGVADLLFLVFSNLENKIWSSLRCTQLAANVSECLTIIYHCKGYEELLLANSNCEQNETPLHNTKHTISFLILDKIQPCLTKINWKENPIHVHVFLSCLAHVKHPHLSDYLDRVLPTSLLLVDDYMPCYKISGLHALQHITDNVTSTELKWQGRADVIYDAVKHALCTNEIALISASYMCMLTVLNKVEITGNACSSLRKPGRYDEVLSTILSNAEIENNLELRCIYTQHIPSLIDKMAITIVRHSNRLLGLIESYLLIADGDEETARVNALIILKSFIIQAWPRVASHKDHILKMLLRLVYDISSDEDTALCHGTVKDSLLDHIETCLVLLSKCCDESEVRACLENVNSTAFKQLPASKFIDKVLMTVS